MVARHYLSTRDSDTINIAKKSLSSQQVWSISFVILLIAGFLLAGLGYNHSLPFIDSPDESTFWTMGRSYIDPSWARFHPEYPPGLPVTSALVQQAQIALGDILINPAVTIQVLRFLTVIMFVMALGAVMLLAYSFGGSIAGIIGGLSWLALPLANQYAKLAAADIWVTACFIVSIWASVRGWQHHSARWIVLGFAFGVLAGFFKWQGGGLAVAVLACLALYKRRNLMIGLGLTFTAIIAAFGYWAVFIHKALEIKLNNLPLPSPGPTSYFSNITMELKGIGPFAIFGLMPILALVIAALWPKLRKRLYWERGMWLLIAAYGAALIFVSLNGKPAIDRHHLPIMALLSSLAGIGNALTVQLIGTITADHRRRWVRRSLLTGLAVLLLAPILWMLRSDILLLPDLQLPAREVYLANWTRNTAVDGPVLVTDAGLSTALKTLYGYLGRPISMPYNASDTEFIRIEDVTQSILDEQNIRYLVAWRGFGNTKITVPLTLLTETKASDPMRGVLWAAYYVGDLPHNLNVLFGDQIVLRGINALPMNICPNDALTTQLTWSAKTTPNRYFSYYLHLFNATTGERSYPINGANLANGDRPTISWDHADELLVGARQQWTVPQDLPPGQYQLWLGVYEPLSNTRLTLPEGTDHYVAATFNVLDCRVF